MTDRLCAKSPTDWTEPGSGTNDDDAGVTAPLLTDPAASAATMRTARLSPVSVPAPVTTPSRLHFGSLEFLFYLCLLAWAHYTVFAEIKGVSDVYSASDRGKSSTLQLLPGLSDGLGVTSLTARSRDNRDYQYRFFRSSLPLLVACFAGFVAGSQTVARLAGRTLHAVSARLAYYALFSCVFLYFCHGPAALFPAALVTGNFAVSRVLRGSRLLLPWTWTFSALVLVMNEQYDGYRFAALSPSLAWLDADRGRFSWHALFNLTVLRMIAHNIDTHWAVTETGTAAASANGTVDDKPCRQCRELAVGRPRSAAVASMCLTCRESRACSLWEANSFAYYWCYLFYPPLTFAGPIVNFNAFVSFVRHPSRPAGRSLAVYAARWLVCVALLEIGLHHFYIFALGHHPAAFTSLSLLALCSLVYLTLNAIWLKFLILWRFFRFWALLDGVEVCENMTKCVDSHHSVRRFWREWHRSFNRWLMRYIYVPMGGNMQHTHTHTLSLAPHRQFARRCLNVLAVFLWVAFWHDRTLQLMAWGCGISLIFVPELTAAAITARCSTLRASRHFRHVRAACAALNIVLMMAANLVGYGMGLRGTAHVVEALQSASPLFLLTTFVTIFAAAQIQIALQEREQEARVAAANDVVKVTSSAD